MKCPVCRDTNLLMAERQGVEIDYCPDCRGVWLDRGELDKIIERANEESAPAARPQESYRDDSRDDRHGTHRDKHHDNQGYGGRDAKPKKKSSLLGDILGGLGGD